MELIKPTVSSGLKEALQELDIDYFIKSTNNLINHRVFWCNKWSDEQNKAGSKILDLLKVECEHLRNSFDNNTLIQINIINAPPDCNNQLFHLDYQGDSFSYFIPFVELSDSNGTEYLYFFEEKNYKIYYDNLLFMSDNYLDKQDAIKYLSDNLGLKINQDFVFKFANSDAYSLLYMPYYVYHRGQKNKTLINRTMLNILFSIGNKFNYPIEEYIILDAEIDEESRAEKILEIRKNTNIT
jgi:hypothetical protein